jgi:hypothetical protein
MYPENRDKLIKCSYLIQRELAIQIVEIFTSYIKFDGLKHTVVYGGVPKRNQKKALNSGIEILVATTGRLPDHFIYLRFTNTVSLYQQYLFFQPVTELLNFNKVVIKRNILKRVRFEKNQSVSYYFI